MPRGRPTDPNKLHFRSIGLPCALWEYLEQWEGANSTQRMQAALEMLRRFAPDGEEIRRLRDEKGRFKAR